ncbi:histidine--tRNA ligase [Natronogracilivirga saccharolytica]|uniref:Histidine--tRNA ligase n=1 Tax=Natronogracilivirga saccharolytica TaxID=2812953 RepID=A0A8J7RG38_9BACT|nr:histidine--tRNA ligase [Natronogracilivirga saccharolytica]MBP3191260.1 histidine--tRNA ligase [Natronogracilivirga saccharolytica]
MEKKKFATHHGMSDLLPGEVENWQVLENIIRETARRFHFQEIRTPVLEQTELIARGVGQLTDIVSKEMFAFDRGEDRYVLRPEGTAPVARAYVQHHLAQRGGTQRLFYIGPFFRAERPQKGRQRQFHQFGAELMGASGAAADVEIIAFMKSIYEQTGIDNTTLKINSVGDPESRSAYKKALYDYFQPLSDKLSEISRRRLETNPMRILDSKEEEDQPLKADAPKITDYLSKASREHYEEVRKLLEQMDIPYETDPFMVRGLDYYTETAFELVSPDLGSQDALGGGGRYDLLVEEIGGPPTPAVGFACGIERLMIACEALGIALSETSGPDVYIVTRGEEAARWAVKTMPGLRSQGLSCTMDYAGRSIKAQMKDANRQQARYAIIVGEQELQDNRYTLRNMSESEEVTLSLDDIKKTILT